MNRLLDLRSRLDFYNADLQKVYKFRFETLKLSPINAYILNVSQPQYNFQNTGTYRGLIDQVQKPAEITITFLEDDNLTVNRLLNAWDDLKWNKNTGKLYPPSVYEDIAVLYYQGSVDLLTVASGESFDQARASQTDSFLTSQQRQNLRDVESSIDSLASSRKSYRLGGLYPINREVYSLDYGNNEILKISVTFNVNDIDPNFASIPIPDFVRS